MGYWNCSVLSSLTKVSFYDAMGVDSLPVVLDMSFYCVRKGILDVSCVTYASLCILLPYTYKINSALTGLFQEKFGIFSLQKFETINFAFNL